MRAETIRLMNEAAELRQTINRRALAAADADDTESRADAEKLIDVDERLKQALDDERAAGEKRDADPQFRALTDGLECRAYLETAIADRKLTGRAAEVNSELELNERQMPYAALLDDEDRAALRKEELELRVDAPTTITDAVKAKPRQSILPRVFRRSDAAWCGIMFPSAPRGLPIYPVMTAGVTGAMKAPGAAQDAEAATFTATMIAPKRATANFMLRVEDIAQFADLESTIRADLRMALSKLMDDQVVSEAATGDNTGSIISHATGAPAQDPSAVATLQNFDDVFTAGIDGLYAYNRSGVRLLIGVETERFLSGKRHDEQATLWGNLLSAAGGDRRATSRVAAPVTNIQKAYRFTPNELRAYAPVWEGLELIRDPYTDAKSGQIRVTGLMIFGFDITRGTITERRFKLA